MTAVAAARDDAASRQQKRRAETATGGTTPAPPSQRQKQQQQQHADPLPPSSEQGLVRCPRCDSGNTKFCYYNNYSLSQPRHFCKACRRYWTKGGALRNVPVGGGCRKNKRSHRSAASASSRLNLPADGGIGVGIGGAAAAARLGFLVGGGGAPVVAVSSADNQGAAAGMLALPRLHAPASVGQYVSFGEWPSSGPAVDLITAGHTVNAGAAVSSSGSIASSIESLSFVNQDLHWKLQQQRLLATIFLPPPPTSGGAFSHMADAGAPGPGMAEPAVPAETASWSVDRSYVLPCPPANTAAATAATTIAANCNINSGNDDHAASKNNCGTGIPAAWSDISSTFTVLP